MYILKNAFANLRRNLGRNLFMFCMMLAIIIVSCVSLTIRNTTQKMMEDYRNKFASEIFIHPNMDIIAKNANQNKYEEIPKLEAMLLLQLAKSKYLTTTKFIAGMSAKSSVKAIENENSNEGGMQSNMTGGNAIEIPPFRLKGYSDIKDEETFKNKTRKLVSGIMPNDKYACLISEELAQKNNLKVGDRITFQGVNLQNGQQAGDTLALKISGIYKYTPAQQDQKFLLFNTANEVYLPYELLIEKQYDQSTDLSATFYLKDTDDLDAFRKEAYTLGLSSLYDVDMDVETYQQIITPVKQMSNVSTLFLIIVLLLGSSLLVLLTILGIRERTYEIGILRSLGMKKKMVMTQMICEAFFIMVFALGIGFMSGSILAQPIADSMLQNELTKEQEQNSNGAMLIITKGDQSESIKEVQINMGGETLLQLFCVSLSLVIISGLVSSIYIMRYEPMRILSERG